MQITGKKGSKKDVTTFLTEAEPKNSGKEKGTPIV